MERCNKRGMLNVLTHFLGFSLNPFSEGRRESTGAAEQHGLQPVHQRPQRPDSRAQA